MDTEVLYEVCSFAFTDSCHLVSSSAEQMMKVLLQGRHLVADDVWWDFQYTLHPVLVLLQVISIFQYIFSIFLILSGAYISF